MVKIPAYRASVAFYGEAFGRRLAAASAQAGLKPKQVAAALGISTETVNRWERGGLKTPPKTGQLRLLSQLLDRDEDWLLEGTAEPTDRSGPGVLPEPATDPDTAARHEEIIRRLDDQDEMLRVLMTRVEEIRSRLE